MGDGGLGAGAALKAGNAQPTALPNVYLGFEAPRTDVFKAIKRNDLTHNPVDLERIADILCEGGVVARACGKMEWGPRALGNRSILPFPTTIRKTTAEQKTAAHRVHALCSSRARYRRGKVLYRHPQVQESLRFMTVCTPTTKLFHQYCPAAVRRLDAPRFLDRDTNQDLYDYSLD